MGGGLALFWNSNVNVNIKSYSSHYIDAVVQNKSDMLWRCTGVYGHLKAKKKHHTWTLLKRLADLSFYPWCYFVDFNEILHCHEKSGGNDRNLSMMTEFRKSIQACNLIDIGYKGSQFTWSNKRFRPHLIEERLDRFLCSKDWRNNFQEFLARNLVN